MVGNNPNFTKQDIIRAFLRIKEFSSRQSLAKNLQIGEGSMRTILDELKEKDLVESSTTGHDYTNNGIKILEQLNNKLTIAKKEPKLGLYTELKKTAMIIKKPNHKININHRDAGIRAGAEVVLLLEFEEELKMPEDTGGYHFESLEELFNYDNGDILIITLAKDKKTSENSAIAIATQITDIAI